MRANELEPQRDGADVWNLRLYSTPFDVPLSLDAEWVYEDNGQALDANAWYVQTYWSWNEARWPMLRLHSNPTSRVGTGLIWFDFSLDQPGSYQGGVESDELGQEINWYMDWEFHRAIMLSLVLARTEPGRAVKEAFDRTKPFKYAMVYLTLDY